MSLMSRLVTAFQSASDASDSSDDEVAAIAAAITEHRRK